MAIVGLNITKIDAEKNEAKGGKVSINNNISVTEVDTKELSLGSAKQKALKIKFLFTCDYVPDLGKINLGGHVMYLVEADKVKEIKERWDKKKILPAEIMEPVINAALNRCNIESIKLSQDINLPSPIPMPRLQREASKGPKKTAK